MLKRNRRIPVCKNALNRQDSRTDKQEAKFRSLCTSTKSRADCCRAPPRQRRHHTVRRLLRLHFRQMGKGPLDWFHSRRRPSSHLLGETYPPAAPMSTFTKDPKDCELHHHPKDHLQLVWGVRLDIGDTVQQGDYFAAPNGTWQKFISLGHTIRQSDDTYWVRMH